MTALITQFWQQVETALKTANPQEKCRLVNDLYDNLLPQIQLIKLDDFPEVVPQDNIAAFPKKPLLVAPKNVPKRSFATEEGYAATLHAIAHIEFNAINLGLDAAWRFGRNAQEELGEGLAFVKDWLRVAREESTHFSLVNEHLKTLGYQYGDFELEARGLDATPILQEKIAQRKDFAAVSILDIILRDEIGHVYIGNHWYHALSKKRGLDAMKCFTELLHKYRIVIFKGVINTDARIQAGFTQHELDWIYEVEQTLKSYMKK